MAIIFIMITSCDYYNAGVEYEDNNALEQVVAWDSENTITPNIFEHDGRCFMKKNKTWMLLNGDATPSIRVMSGKKIQCMNKNEIEWASRVCVNITDEDRLNLNALICGEYDLSTNTNIKPAS